MFSKVSVLVPTRGRVQLLRRLLASYDRTTSGAPDACELVFRADEDDTATIDLLTEHGHPMVIGPRGRGYADLPQFFNELAQVARGDVLMLGNDDVVFVTPGWAPAVLAVANRYPDGLFNIGVTTHNESHFPLSIVSAAVVRCLGFIYDPRIFWGDIYLRDVMGRLGRQMWLREVEIQHDWVGHAPDRTFIEGEGARRAPGNHMQHHEAAVSEAVAKLVGLLQVPGSISFIVATSNRPTLAATLASIELRPGDELLVVGDGIPQLDARARYIQHAPGNNWGHAERNTVMAQAKCQYLAHLDDDDTYVPGHRAIMARALEANPGRPVIFRMKYRSGALLWRDKVVACGNVGTPMVVLPNDAQRRGRFGDNYGGDIHYVESFAAQAGYTSADFVWCEDVAVLIRPHT